MFCNSRTLPGHGYCLQHLIRLGSDADDGFAHLAAVAVGEKLRQKADVVPSVAQRRQVDLDDIDAVIEILPEESLPNHRLQVSSRRGDDADIDFDFIAAADPSNLPFLKRAQKFGL